MEMEQIQNGNRSPQKMKKYSMKHIQQENTFFRMHACKLRYQSAYEGFRNNATLNTVPVKGIAALHACCSVHAVSTHLTRKCPKMRVISRSRLDIACKITHSRSTGTH